MDNNGLLTATAGTGITVSGTQNIQIGNTGVLSLDGEVGNVNTRTATYYKTSNQTINQTGNPSFVSISWNASTTASDTATISQTAPNSNLFNVNVKGLYLINIGIQYNNVAIAVLPDKTLRINMNVIRGAGNSIMIQNTYDFPDNVPTNPAQSITGIVQLNVGDQLFFQSVQYLNNGSFTLQSQAVAPNDYDLNTYWTWVMLKPL
ncbi:MAG: hypothetical protein EBR27_04405 [Betaproteobacteria bacterium]|nr:hypothetical protein [Betaproteobacteria bacterium]